MTTKGIKKAAKKELEWKMVDVFDPKTYPDTEKRYLFEVKNSGFKFFGWFDGELVRSLLKARKKKGAEEHAVVVTLSNVSRFCEDGTTEIFHDGILR